MNESIVTVVIPTYNRSELLKRAIESVLNQTYSSLRIIVSDNASDDDTKDVIDKLMQKDDRICFYSQDTNIGMNANFNFLFSKVESEYFCLLTDDDYYESNFLYDAMLGFKQNKTAMFSILGCPTISTSGDILFNKLDLWPDEGLYEKGQASYIIISGNCPVITGIIFKKEILKEVIFKDDYGVASDVLILLKLCAKYNFVLSKKIGLYHIFHSKSIGLEPISEELRTKQRAYMLSQYDKWFHSGLLTQGNTDSEKIARVILKKKIPLLFGMTNKYIDEGIETSLINYINNPVKYPIKIHLYFLKFKLYVNIMSFFKKIYYLVGSYRK